MDRWCSRLEAPKWPDPFLLLLSFAPPHLHRPPRIVHEAGRPRHKHHTRALPRGGNATTEPPRAARAPERLTPVGIPVQGCQSPRACPVLPCPALSCPACVTTVPPPVPIGPSYDAAPVRHVLGSDIFRSPQPHPKNWRQPSATSSRFGEHRCAPWYKCPTRLFLASRLPYYPPNSLAASDRCFVDVHRQLPPLRCRHRRCLRCCRCRDQQQAQPGHSQSKTGESPAGTPRHDEAHGMDERFSQF